MSSFMYLLGLLLRSAMLFQVTSGSMKFRPLPSECNRIEEFQQRPYGARLAKYKLRFRRPINGFQAFRIVLGLNGVFGKCRYNGLLDL
ncbi:hypothetical protein T265_12335 [Opisthorchis viverrini]|uniref:Secreted protein n=1 Tax=Opisthorchis viverrini TaxID=6198 RepID=A0A074YTW0_OPIVI|nr:hypothetical protein T265_12335 [Opisthorchis viverrini]KER18221.1 hypothetical protein T265_12335 [Opisthorchis viverrini]